MHPCIAVPTSSVEAELLRAGGLQADEDPDRGSGDPEIERDVGSITPSSWPRAPPYGDPPGVTASQSCQSHDARVVVFLVVNSE